MKYLVPLALVLQGTAAFPSLFGLLTARGTPAQTVCFTSDACNAPVPISDSQIGLTSVPTDAQMASAATSNDGPTGSEAFDAETQYVSTTGQYAYQSPSANYVRGPCPGLNAAANHGYISRNGVLNVDEALQALPSVYGMASDLIELLATYAVAFSGDIVSGLWAIGGPTGSPSTGRVPEGISYSHNKFEGDASLTRCDAYINDGDAHSLSPTRFSTAYQIGMNNDLYTFDKFAQLYAANTLRSAMTNDMYYAPLFSAVMAPAMYAFAINFFSNHSADLPAGYLNGYVLKSFFGTVGESPNFEWLPGQERIPNNWYKRFPSNEFGVTDLFELLTLQYTAYPVSFRFGGNVNGVNSYTPIDINKFTGGAYDQSTLFEGTNFQCFFYRDQVQSAKALLKNGYNSRPAAYKMVKSQLRKNFNSLNCTKVRPKYNKAPHDHRFIARYPGHTYNPIAANDVPSNC